MINAASKALPSPEVKIFVTAVKENACMLLFLMLSFSHDWRAMISKSGFSTADMHSYCMKYGVEVKYTTGC